MTIKKLYIRGSLFGKELITVSHFDRGSFPPVIRYITFVYVLCDNNIVLFGFIVIKGQYTFITINLLFEKR